MTSLLSGPSNTLLSLIKADASLQLCFRGKYFSVYYKGDSLFKISLSDRGGVAAFDFNHARKTESWEISLKKLKGLGYAYFEGKGDVAKRSRKVIYRYRSEGKNLHDLRSFWEESIRILKPLVDDFLDLEKKYDYFKGSLVGRNSEHLERQRQQQIMRANNSLKGEYFIYDMEYDQPRNSSVSEAKSGRFDMLALRRISTGRYSLVFIELKSTPVACGGGSGIEKHRVDLERYICNEKLIGVRKNDAVEICRQYGELGLVEKEEVKVEGVEMLFVFTDKAMAHAGKIKNTWEKCILPGAEMGLKYNIMTL